MTKQRSITRRGFLKRTGVAAGILAGFPSIIPASALGANGAVAPSNRITLGFIGLGVEGREKNLKAFLWQPDAQVVALCDVDDERTHNAHLAVQLYARREPISTFRSCDTTRDWREIVARDDIDAVVISTPDHWHVLPAVAAAKAGKDVFCEKPVSLTVYEGRVLSDTMRRYGHVFQTASENRSRDGFSRACELVRNGRIGKLHTMRTLIYRGFGAEPGNSPVPYEPRDPPAEPVPPGFDYDMWLGQAPEAPYTPLRCHGNYRYILDYSGGNLTDWGAHIIDIAQWGNGTDHTGPVSVEGRGVFPRTGLYNVARDWEIAFEYANGVKHICRSGGFSVRFEGTEGWVEADWDTVKASSPQILESVIGPEEIHLRTCRHGEHRDFLNCVKSRQDTYAPAEIGHRTVTLGHIGNIAMILGRKLQWDPDTEQFLNDAQANRMLSRSMRSPWRLDA